MGYLPDQHLWSQAARQARAPRSCLFCAAHTRVLYLLPTYGLAAPDEPASVACGGCYRQITFSTPRLADRVIAAEA